VTEPPWPCGPPELMKNCGADAHVGLFLSKARRPRRPGRAQQSGPCFSGSGVLPQAARHRASKPRQRSGPPPCRLFDETSASQPFQTISRLAARTARSRLTPEREMPARGRRRRTINSRIIRAEGRQRRKSGVDCVRGCAPICGRAGQKESCEFLKREASWRVS
jgi:hypothetical protein